MSHDSNGFLLSLTVSPVPWSCYMSLTVSIGCWLSLTVSPSAMELLHVSHCLLLLLAVVNYSSRPMELQHVFYSQPCLLAFSHSLSPLPCS